MPVLLVMNMPTPLLRSQPPPTPTLRVGGTIYNNHTLKLFKELGFESQRFKKLALTPKTCSHTQISIATTSKEMSLNPLLKQSANHHRPFTFLKLSVMPVLSVMNMPTPLLKSQPPPTPILQTPPSEQQAPREFPSTTSNCLQKKT